MTDQRIAELKYIGACCGIANMLRVQKTPMALEVAAELLIEETDKYKKSVFVETVPISQLPETLAERVIRITEASE